MNKVNLKKSPVIPVEFQMGDIFINSTNDVYILCTIDSFWHLIGFENGCHWNGGHSTVEKAIEDFSFLGRNVKINISLR